VSILFASYNMVIPSDLETHHHENRLAQDPGGEEFTSSLAG